MSEQELNFQVEKDELEKQIAEMLAGAKSKNERKRINKEAEEMRRKLFEKQQSENIDPVLAAINQSNPVQQQTPEPETPPPKKKKTNTRNQREKKQKRMYEMQAAAMQAASQKTQGQIETENLEKQIESLGLTIKPVLGDGHCLFRAVAAALESNGLSEYSESESYKILRRRAADEMRSNPDSYIALTECDSPEAFKLHCDKIESTAEWGDSAELSALSRALNMPIIVHSLLGEPQKYGEGEAGIHLVFHAKFTSSGGHYNAAVPK